MRAPAVALDVGSKTIGVAVSDALGIAAHPRAVIARQGTARDVEAVLARVREEGAVVIVVGLPLELDGRVGPRARRVVVLIDALRAALPEGVLVETWDERFSTVGANVALGGDAARRVRKSGTIDAHAAAFLLEGWMAAQARAE